MAGAVYPFEVTHRDVWRIALPATFAFVTEPLAGLVDLIAIGRLGDVALLGGLVLGALAANVIFSFAFFLRLGTAGLVAQAVGARDVDQGFVHFARALLVAAGFGLLLIVLIPAILWLAALILAPDAEIVGPFETYLGIRIFSAPMVLINFALLGWFYGRAEATIGMVLQLVIHAVNMVLTVLFVFGLGWGVAGAAWATLFAELAAAMTGLGLVTLRLGGLARIRAGFDRQLFFDLGALKRLFGLSRDLLIRTAVLEAAFTWFMAEISRAGPVVLAANSILLNLVMFIAFFLDGQAQAAEQLCGKAVGARYRPAFERGMHLSLLWGYAVAGGLTLFMLFAGPLVIGLMTTALEVQKMALDFLPIAIAATLTGVAPFVMDGVMQGATLNTLIRNGMIASFLIFVALALLLEPLFGVTGLWLALHGFFLARGAIFYVAVRRKVPRLFAG